MNNLRFGSFVLDARLRQLQRDGERLALPAKAFDLLWFMGENAGRPLTKSELLTAVWPDSFVEESNLTHNIFLLRKALGPAAESTIITLPGRGYQFAATVELVPDFAATELPIAAPASLEASRSRLVYEEVTEERVGFWRSPLALGITGVAAVAMAAAAWLGWQRWEDRVGGAPVQVVMADLDGSTGDPVLDRTLTIVTRSELAQSPFVSLLSGSTLRATLTQMMHKPTDPVTVATAREACERTGSQAVLHESVAHTGKGFVITEEATNCVDGSSLALVHEEAAKADDLPGAIRKANAVVRHGLGESRRTIARYNAPLTATNTPSIDALKDYSQASFLATQGHFAEAIELQKQAVTLDPGFAAAYFDLSGAYFNTLDPANGRIALQKAYDLRNSATEPTRLYINARYHGYVTGDIYESIRNYRAWIAMYPRQVQPWSGLFNAYTQLGQAPDELEPAQRVMQLAPTNLIAWQGLADAQISNADYVAGRHTLEVALSKHFDVESIHYLLLRVGYLQHDATLIAQENAWGKAHPESPIFVANQAAYAIQQGRMKEGLELLAAMTAAFTRGGNAAAGTRIEQGEAMAFATLGDVEDARMLLHKAPPSPAEYGYLVVLAQTGDPAQAGSLLQQQLALRPHDTLWNGAYKELVLAQIGFAQGRPADVLVALQSPTFDGVGADFRYLRGAAFLALKRWPEAENEFRTLLAHPEVEPNGYDLPLAQVQLARVLVAEGRRAEAADAYRDFLSFWSMADPDQPVLLQARRELAALR